MRDGRHSPFSPTSRRAAFALTLACTVAMGAGADATAATRRTRTRRAATTTVPRARVAPSTTAAAAPTATPAAADPARWVMGYYLAYEQAMYPPEQLDFSVLTHLAISRVRPRADGTLDTDFDLDPASGPVYAKAMTARVHAAKRKAMLMVGGAGDHDTFAAAAAPANRATFVANLLAAVDAYGFDGVDLDWEPITDADHAPLLELARELRRARPALLLSVPIMWLNPNYETAPPALVALAQVVDRLNVMSYGMADAWESWTVWHSGALRGGVATSPSAIDTTIRMYRAAGLPMWKVGIGVGFFGSCWAGPTAPGQPVTGARIAAGDHVVPYARIVTEMEPAGTKHWDDAAQVPWLSFERPTAADGCTFLSYEDERSAAAKAAFVRSEGLGGIIVWTVNQGHLPGAPAGRRDPLLAALRP